MTKTSLLIVLNNLESRSNSKCIPKILEIVKVFVIDRKYKSVLSLLNRKRIFTLQMKTWNTLELIHFQESFPIFLKLLVMKIL